jgi:hypothetical protein
VITISQRGVDVPRRGDLEALHPAGERGPGLRLDQHVHVSSLQADVNDPERLAQRGGIEASRIALYILRRRRLPTAGTTRITTCSA